MRYTTLRVTEAGVVLLDGHCERLGPEGSDALEAFRRFAASAAPGVYSVLAEGGALRIQARGGSRLHDGIATRLRVSPIAQLHGPVPKMPSPCVYDDVRDPGVATLLTSDDGREILEACVAAVVGWDGRRFVLTPPDRPRVASVSERAIRRGLPFVEAPLSAGDRLPLVLVNAVKGPCLVDTPGREPMPEGALDELSGLFARETRRP